MSVYKSRRGRSIDVDKFREQNDKEIAVGNMGVNARGDKLGSGGEIVEPSKERTAAYYVDNPNAVKHVSIKQAIAETRKQSKEDVAKASDNTAVAKPASKRRVTKKAPAKPAVKEVVLENGDIVHVDEEQNPDFDEDGM